MIPLGPYEPDKGALNRDTIDTVVNLLPLSNGWGPMSDTTEFSDALPSECKGAWWFRSNAGTFNTVAATQSALFKLNSTSGAWTPIGKLGSDTILTGAFGADSDWTKGTNVTISAGAAHFTATPDGQALSQAQSLTATYIYQVVYTVSNYSAG